MIWTRFAAVCASVLVSLLGGCANVAVRPEAIEAVERRLLSPYQESLAVIADQLEIEISANFDHEVARPATSRTGEVGRQRQGGDTVFRWVSKGGVQEPLRFVIGATKFAALHSATLRVRGSGQQFALNCAATGRVTVAGDHSSVHCQELRIENGVLQKR